MSTVRVSCAFFRSLTLKRLLTGASALALSIGLVGPAVAGCQSGDIADPGEAQLHGSGCRGDAPGSLATAVGLSSFAGAPNTTVVGAFAGANGGGAIAVGLNAKADGTFSTSLGINAGLGESAEGFTNIGAHTAGPSGRYSTAVGAGADTPVAPRAQGAWSIAIGGGEANAGPGAQGPGALADGIFSIAIGNKSVATGVGYAVALGYNAKANVGLAPTAVGTDSTAQGENAAAFGRFAGATAQNSTALGSISNAIGVGSTAIGTNFLNDGAGNNVAGARSTNATAVGYQARATAANSSAFGFRSAAFGLNSAALGSFATASHSGSVALGQSSVTSANNTVSVGSGTLKRRITNVAAAVNGTDAVNLKQVKSLIAASALAGAKAGMLAAEEDDEEGSTENFASENDSAGDTDKTAAPRKRLASREELGAGSGAAKEEDELEPSTIVGWANVKMDGSIADARNVKSNSRPAPGQYEIVFKKKSLKRCSWNATLAGAGVVSVKAGSAANSLIVETRNHYGAATDAAFNVMVVC